MPDDSNETREQSLRAFQAGSILFAGIRDCAKIVSLGPAMESPLLIETHQEWAKANYSFCPKCGGRLQRRSIKPTEPDRLVCLSCGFVFFLDPKVAVGTIVTLDGGILLVKRGIEPAYGKWVFPGGFVDRGERVEEAAVRETREESCVEVQITRLLNIYSYPDHPVIIIVYVGEAVGGCAAAGDETLEVGLFPPPSVPWDQLAFPSTAQALRDYLASR
ncbi:NUDIX domain-containing protein [Candidatus Nitrospira bockiana]